MENHTTGFSEKSEKPFAPPRHWVGPEELNESYWKDPKIQEKRGQEFYEKPVEMISLIDQTDKEGIARRDFLTIMGASIAMSAVACGRRPVHKIIPYVVKPEELTPGVANWYASTSADCGHGCGLLIRSREGRPVKLEGNPDHPLNQGALCATGQASLFNLYDPARVKAPVSRSRGTEAGQEITWEQLDQAVIAKLKAIANGPGRVRVLTGAITGDSTRRLVRDFVGAFKAGEHVEYEALAQDELAEGQAQSYGARLVPHYRFDEADVVVSFGADFLNVGTSPVEYSVAWAKNRKLDSKNAASAKLSKFFAFEPTFTNTGANADERYPIRPGDEIKIALAIANEVLFKHKISSYGSDVTLRGVVADYTAAKVAQEIKVDGLEQGIVGAAEALAHATGKGIVVAGGLQSRGRDAVALQIAVNLLNSALGNEGATVDGGANNHALTSSFASISKLVADMKGGLVDALIIHHANPAYTLPAALGFAEALKKVPLVVAVVERENETSIQADYSAADHHFLENWGDASPRRGLYSLQQPAIAPLHNTRAFQDTLLIWARAVKPSALVAKAKDWHDFLRENWRETVHREAGTGAFETFWENTLQKGVLAAHSFTQRSGARPLRAASFALLPRYSEADAGAIYLALFAGSSLEDGRHANNAWLQELPDPLTSVTWDNCLAVSPATAARLGFQDDDVVEVKAGDARAELPVCIQPGMHAAAVSIAVGYGRRVEGKVGKEAGVNVFPFVGVENGRAVFSGQTVKLAKTGRNYRLARTQWHTTTESRPIINDITLAEFRKNPAVAMETDPELREKADVTMWPKHEYKGYRWGMAIDLNSCTGCGACVVACQVENNIPVVGRDQVRLSRQMQWIRIDRYYSGNPENPDVIFHPMLCQHCENAPCETVCPVLATVHDDEGLNVQVYNRCVGTRYCQNNCPYKVRKFNFFDHWKSYETTLNLAWNPDITVRTRGIMEKCTFCVQRIREVKDQAKDLGIHVKDGSLKTACQQTCATDAIVFGDINDPTTRVSKLKADQRAFTSLATLNTKPSISYMTKVRNKAGHEEAQHS